MTTPLPSYRPPAAPLPLVGLEEARERAVRLLSDGYAYDRLSESEFEWRIDRLNSSSTPAAVDALVADLLAPAAAIVAPDGERRILALMSNTRHGGIWTVPPRLRLSAVMSELRLDLRQAALPPVCTIDLFALMANVQIIVPPDVPVHFDVGAVMASTRNDAAPTSALPAGLRHVFVRGSAVMSEVRVRVRARG